MRRGVIPLFLCWLLTACTMGTLPEDALTPEAAILPTAMPCPTRPTASPVPTQTSPTAVTPIPANEMRGEWHRFDNADGLCTDWPVLVGRSYIGTGTRTVCYPSGPIEEGDWASFVVPLGTTVRTVDLLPPTGAMIAATDAGVCFDTAWMQQEEPARPIWQCQDRADGFPYEGVRGIILLTTGPVTTSPASDSPRVFPSAGRPVSSTSLVYWLSDAVAFDQVTYRLPEILGVDDARPTWVTVAHEIPSRPFIWVGTNGHGLVRIDPRWGTLTRYTTADGLPGDEIRDVQPGYGDGNLWVATDNGVGRWDGQRWTAYTTAAGLPSNDVLGVSSGQQHTVWAATAAGGAYFDGSTWRAFTRQDGLPEGDLKGVMAWSDQVWFSTRGSGLLVLMIEPPAP